MNEVNVTVMIVVALVLVGILAFVVWGYNELRLRLNGVKAARSVVTETLARRGIAPADFLAMAREAGLHEKMMQVEVARGRGGGGRNVLFVREETPRVTSTFLFDRAQQQIETFEAEYLAAWNAFVAAAHAYEDARTTLPLLIVASLFWGMFPPVFD